MAVGLPVIPEDRPTFFMPPSFTTDGSHTSDQGGTPFNPTYRPTRDQSPGIRVPCAVEYQDSGGTMAAAGAISTSELVLTFLDEDYAVVRGFAYVVVGGIRYNYERDEKPTGLVSVGIYTVHCMSDDEG